MNSEWLVALRDTSCLVGASLGIAVAFGVPLGFLLTLTAAHHVWPAPRLQRVCSKLVDIWRAVPFVLLLIVCAPLCRLLGGSAVGVRAALVPMALASIPFAARLTEAALRRVDRSAVDAARSMGASMGQILRHVLLPEARSGLVKAFGLSLLALGGASMVAGAGGAGGLGALAVRQAMRHASSDVVLVIGVAWVALLHLLQVAGERLIQTP